MGCIAIGSPSVIVQVDGHIHAVVDGDALTYIHLQRHRAAVLRCLDGSGQRSVLLAVVLRRQICTAFALFAVFIGLIKVVVFRRCRIPAHAALRAVGQPVRIGGAGQGVLLRAFCPTDALPGVGAVAVICPAGVAVIYRAAVLATQVASGCVVFTVVRVCPQVIFALFKGRTAVAGGFLHFSGRRSHRAGRVSNRQLAGAVALEVEVQHSVILNGERIADGQRCPVAQNQVDILRTRHGEIAVYGDVLLHHIPAVGQFRGFRRDLRAVGMFGGVAVRIDILYRRVGIGLHHYAATESSNACVGDLRAAEHIPTVFIQKRADGRTVAFDAVASAGIGAAGELDQGVFIAYVVNVQSAAFSTAFQLGTAADR